MIDALCCIRFILWTKRDIGAVPPLKISINKNNSHNEHNLFKHKDKKTIDGHGDIKE